MPHSEWRNSPAKQWIKERLEEGIIHPDEVDINALYHSNPDLLNTEKSATKRTIEVMNRPSEGKFIGVMTIF